MIWVIGQDGMYQNSQGGPITATKLVPGGTNLVAVLVPGGPILGGTKFGMTATPVPACKFVRGHQIQFVCT